MPELQAIYGIDFSGALDAGNKIWIAKGISDGEKLILLNLLKSLNNPAVQELSVQAVGDWIGKLNA